MAQAAWISSLKDEHQSKVHIQRETVFRQPVSLGNSGLKGLIKSELVYARNNRLGAMEVTAAAVYGSDEYDPNKHDLLKATMMLTASNHADVQQCALSLRNELAARVSKLIPGNLKGEQLRVAALNALVSSIENVIKSTVKTKCTIEDSPSLMSNRRKGVKAQPAGGNQNNYQGDYNNSKRVLPLIETLPPMLLRDELLKHGQINIIDQAPHTGSRTDYKIGFVHNPQYVPDKFSFWNTPDSNQDALSVILQRDSEWLNNSKAFLTYCVETGNVFPEVKPRTAEAVFDFIQKNRLTNDDWIKFDGIEVGASVFREINEYGIAREPLSYGTPSKAKSKAMEVLSNWRKLPAAMVEQKVASGQLTTGLYHFGKSNKLNANAVLYEVKYSDADSPLTVYDESKPRIFAMMSRATEHGSNAAKLLKLASGKNKGYFAGYPKEGAGTLILNESLLDTDSIQVLSRYAQSQGIETESSAVALLSTVGLVDFLKRRFHVSANYNKAKDTLRLAYTHPVENNSKGELLNNDQKEHLKRVFFTNNTTFVHDGTSQSDKMYAAIQSLGMEVTGREVSIKKITSAEQQGYISQQKPVKNGGDVFLDAASVATLISSCELVPRTQDGTVVWRHKPQRWCQPVDLDRLSPTQKNDLQSRVAFQMNEVLKVRSLTSGFDNDTGGRSATLILRSFCEKVGIQHHDILLPKIKVNKGKLNTGKEVGMTEDHNDFLMAIEVAKENGQQDLAKELLTQWASAMPKRMLENQLKNDEGSANGRKR